MTTRARDGGLLDTGSIPGVLTLVALGLGLIAYGIAGVTDDGLQTIFVVLRSFAIAAGAAFLVSAALGTRSVLRQRTR